MESEKTRNAKNTIVLKNLPSNLIEEAIIVFKNKKTVKEIKKSEKERKNDKTNFKEENVGSSKKQCYAIKEAELLIDEYISNMEIEKRNKNWNKWSRKRIENKCKKLKIFSILTTCSLIVETIIVIAL